MRLTPRRAVILLLIALSLVVAMDNLERPLANPDEGRYSEIAREMALSGDWITPRLDGLKYFEKPPLQYWATAAAFRLLGESEPVARLYTFLCAGLAFLAIAFTMRRLAGPERSLLAMAVLLSSPYFILLGGIVTLDMGVSAWLTVAVCAFLLAQREGSGDRERRRWMLLAWAGMALAVLSKGLVGIVFPGAAIFLYCVAHRDLSVLRRLEWARGIALFLALAAPWFVLVSLENPEFAHFFFVHEHFERFLTTAHRREEPWWYFIPILFVGFLPWMVALVPACIDGWRLERDATGLRWRRFAILWSAFIVVFFSASGSKLPHYILPVFPTLALVLGDWLERAPPRRIAVYLAPVVPVMLVLLAYGWIAAGRGSTPWARELNEAARPWVVGGGLALALGIVVAAWLMRGGRKLAAIAIVVAMTMVFIDGIEDGYEQLTPRQSGKGVAAAMQPWLGPDTRIYSVLHYDQTLPFYLKRLVTLVAYRDEFSLGEAAEPDRALHDVEVFVEDWLRPGSAVAIIQPGFYEEVLRPAGLPMIPIHVDERRVVVRKP